MMRTTIRTAVGLITALLAQFSLAQTANLDPIPSYYQEPGISPQRDYTNQHANETVDPFTGKLQLHYVDLLVPGNGGLDIKVQRSYSSGDGILRDPTPYGFGWTMGFGRVVRTTKLGITLCDTQRGSVHNPVLELPDGSRQILYVSSDQLYFISANRWKATCSGINGMSVYSPDGTRYDMNYPGPLIGGEQQSWYPNLITDRNGNTLTITYRPTAGSIGVDTVTASDGRVVTFGYDGGTGAIASVSDGTRTFTYTTTAGPGAGQFYLTKVTRPDTTTWEYEYNPFDMSAGAGSINKVTNPTGGSFSYSYALMRFNQNLLPTSHVVTRKTGSLDPSWEWTYSYTPASTPAPTGATQWEIFCPSTQIDVTVVSGPEGSTTYCHVGFNSANSSNGVGYLIGTLVQKKISASSQGPTIFTEGISRGYQVLSTSQSMIRGDDGVVMHNSVLVPISKSKHIDAYGQVYATDYSGYDLYGNPGTVTETGTTTNGNPDTRVTTLTYQIDPSKWIIHTRKDEAVTVNGSAAGTITRQFDDRMNLLNEVKFGVQNSWTYFTTGDRLTHTNARGATVTYSDYMRGIPQKESHPEGVVISRVVDAAGNVTSETDGEGSVTDYSYDGLNRIKSIRPGRGNSVLVTRTPNTRTVTRGSNGEKTTYDAFGRATQIQHLSSLTPAFTRDFLYDPIGRQIFASDPNVTAGKRTDYDALGRETAVKWPCQGYAGGCETARYMAWNANVYSVANERGYVTRYTFRGFGDPASQELIRIEPPDAAATVAIKRDGLGKPLEISQGGITRTFGYDSTTHFLTSSSEPETGTTTFGRDAVGNMTSRKVGSNPEVSYDYDDLNRLRATTYPAGTPSVTRTYFRDGKLKSLDNGVVRQDYEYDFNKNLTKQTLVVDGNAFVLANAYDGNDVLSTVTYPSGKTVSYEPDAFGRPTKATPYVTAVTYDSTSGAMRSFTYGNGMIADIGYNSRYLPSSLKFGQGSPVFSQTYSYGLTGNLQSVSDWLDLTYARAMSYDGMERLTEIKGPWGNGSIQYDAVGNIRSQTFGSTSLNYQYDPAANRIQSVTGSITRNYAYDGYGNVIGDGVRTFVYSDAQNLRCARCGQADEIAYRYDGDGTRVSAQPAGGLMTYFVHAQSGQLLLEQSGQTLKEYAYLKDRQIAVRTAHSGTGGGTAPSGGSTSFAVTLAASSTAPRVGETVTLSAGVTNGGTQTASTVALTNSLPMGLEFVSASSACSASSGVVQCNLGDLAAGAQASVQIVARVISAGTLIDFVTASSLTPIKVGAAANYASVALNATADAASAAPTVSLVTPSDGATFQDPATIALSATASDSDGSIQYVDFYNGVTLIGRAKSAPYTFIWDKVAPGSYALSARAVDSAGQSASSNVASVSVSPGNGPSVSITSPTSGEVFRVLALGLTRSIPLAASASAQTGSISRVEFFNGAKLIGISRTAPYTATWNAVGVGSYILSAKAYDSNGKATTSSSVPVSVQYNQVPSVVLSAPINGARFGRSATITLVADAADYGGAITKVDFFNRTTLLGTVTTPPYTFAWSNAPVGTHVLTARATDAEGATAASPAVSIAVIDNAPPTVALTTPSTGAAYNAPASIAISATAGDADGTISKVEFLNGSTVLGAATAAPYSFTWSGVASGSYALTARATDNLGAATTSSSVAVTVNAPPAVSIATPSSGATFTAPASITISASAADSDGSVSKVDFYNGATLIGTATAAPYAFTWSTVPAGAYSLTAKATDNRGAVTTSGAVSVTVTGANASPSVTLTAPTNGATFNAPASITLSATASDSDGSISKVEFYNGTSLLRTDTTSPYSFSWTGVAAGSYTLTAKATDNKGATTTSAPVGISVNALPTVSLTAPASGATFRRPVTITISASASDGDGTITKVEFYRGTTRIGTDTTAPYSVTWTPSAAGTYSLTAKATDNKGGTRTSAARSITVR